MYFFAISATHLLVDVITLTCTIQSYVAFGMVKFIVINVLMW